MNLARPALRKTRIEMVPLIDSFFLLLAFFISSVLSMSVIGGLPVELPAVGSVMKLESKDLVVITVARNGELQCDGQSLALEELPTRVKTHSRLAALRVAVRADRLVPAGRLLEVLSAVRGAGVSRVGLVTDMAHPTTSRP